MPGAAESPDQPDFAPREAVVEFCDDAPRRALLAVTPPRSALHPDDACSLLDGEALTTPAAVDVTWPRRGLRPGGRLCPLGHPSIE